MTPTPAPIDRGAALLGLVVVVLANVRYLAGLSEILDPVLAMEPFYIDMAKRPVGEILAHDPAWGPLYAVWLRPFRLLLGDPLRVYAANVHALSFGLSLATYAYALLATRRAAIAAGAALFMVLSDLNVPLASKVAAFAVIVVLVGLALSRLAARADRRLAIAAGGALVAGYARPELYPAGLGLWIAAVWVARGDLLARRPWSLGWVAGGTGALVATAWWIGTPIWSPHHQEGRLLDAFREHFAVNWMRWNGASDYYLTIWRRELGDADGIAAAFRHNPAAVARHVGDNLAGIARALLGGTFDHYPFLATTAWPALVKVEALAVSLASAACVVTVLIRGELRAMLWRRHRLDAVVWCLLAVFPIGGAAVVYPNVHYLIVPSVGLVLAAAFAIAVVLPEPAGASAWRRGAVATLCLAAIPTPFALPTGYFAPRRAPVADLGLRREVTETVHRIRALALPAPVHVLTLSDGIGELLGAGFVEVKIWQRGPRPLRAYLEDEHVDVIVTLEPGRQSFRVDDPYWETIQLDPAATGFAPVVTAPGATARIWVRADRVAPPPRETLPRVPR